MYNYNNKSTLQLARYTTKDLYIQHPGFVHNTFTIYLDKNYVTKAVLLTAHILLHEKR